MPVLTDRQIAAVARSAGFPAAAAVYAVAITHPEAGANSGAVQAGQPYATTGWGLWQITPGNSEPQFGTDHALLNPLNNARAAHAKWSAAGGFSPWTTFMDGAYGPYLPGAEAAVRFVYHLSAAALQNLTGQAGTGASFGDPPVTHSENWSDRVKASGRHVTTAARHFHGYAAGIERLHTHNEH
jgi:Lysozyme like domain